MCRKCVIVWHKEGTYILKALLVEGLSPSNWRILTSEAVPLDRTLRIAEALCDIWPGIAGFLSLSAAFVALQ